MVRRSCQSHMCWIGLVLRGTEGGARTDGLAASVAAPPRIVEIRQSRYEKRDCVYVFAVGVRSRLVPKLEEGP
jgi:hypothetical protein